MNCSVGTRRAWARICDSPSTHIAPQSTALANTGLLFLNAWIGMGVLSFPFM
jgi:hypothetical protein